MISTYKTIEKFVLPVLKNFEDDLKVCDKALLKKYHGDFLYGYRANGTNIYKLDIDSFDYSYDFSSLERNISNSLYVLTYPNKHFLYFDGSELKEVTKDDVEDIINEFKEKVRKRKEYIEKINIPEIAFDLFHLMRDFKNKWKRIAIDSNIACRRRFRNHFNFDKVKASSELKDIEDQLYKNLSIA